MRNSQIHINDLNSFSAKIKQQIFEFEMHSFKTKAKIIKNQKLLNDAINELEYYRKTRLYGFNCVAGLLGLLSYHSVYIYNNRHMLSELSFFKARNHILGSIIFGTVIGYITGYTIAKNFKTYSKYNKVRKEIEDMNRNFEYYYIFNKEQQFDD